MRSVFSIAKSLAGLIVSALLLGLAMGVPQAQVVTVSVQGTVKDPGGNPLAGAEVRIVETSLTTTTDAGGAFDLKGTFNVGILRRVSLPGGEVLEHRQGRLRLSLPAGKSLEALLVGSDGKSRRWTAHGKGGAAQGTGGLDVEAWLGPTAGAWFLRLGSGPESRTFRLIRAGAGSPLQVWAHGAAAGRSDPTGPGASSRGFLAPRGREPGRKRAAASADSANLILEVTAAGRYGKRRLVKATEAGVAITLLPLTATFKERVQDFIGPAATFRLAYLKKESAASRKHVLHYVDWEKMAGDTLTETVFPDSRGPANPESTPFGANVPSWSPDGKTLAYEIGAESQTVNNVSQIWLQPLAGARLPGPGFPATNPRWHANGTDTALVWCTSGRDDAWKDTASRTLRQQVVGGALTGQPETVAKGSFNGGLSGKEKLYLATAFRYGMMLDLAAQSLRSFHIYPGQPRAKDGSPAESLQTCNASISPDPARPTRMLFLDFGVPAGETPYPNLVRPQHYAQHQMILMGDFHSEAPGRIVDFIDSPAEELAKEKTWDDPEWSNHPDFAVATTRDADGDISNPSEPRPTQPDIYLIHLPTKASLKVISGDHFTMPTLWIGSKP